MGHTGLSCGLSVEAGGLHGGRVVGVVDDSSSYHAWTDVAVEFDGGGDGRAVGVGGGRRCGVSLAGCGCGTGAVGYGPFRAFGVSDELDVGLDGSEVGGDNVSGGVAFGFFAVDGAVNGGCVACCHGDIHGVDGAGDRGVGGSSNTDPVVPTEVDALGGFGAWGGLRRRDVLSRPCGSRVTGRSRCRRGGRCGGGREVADVDSSHGAADDGAVATGADSKCAGGGGGWLLRHVGEWGSSEKIKEQRAKRK